MLWLFVLLGHMLVAITLVGAITHQMVSVVWRPRRRGFVSRYGAVSSAAFTNAVIAIYLVTFALGSWLYTDYRYKARPVLEDLGLERAVGLFELKEHMLAVGLMLLPAYWYYWRRVPHDRQRVTRAALTLIIGVSIWVGLLGGHVTNNARGV